MKKRRKWLNRYYSWLAILSLLYILSTIGSIVFKLWKPELEIIFYLQFLSNTIYEFAMLVAFLLFLEIVGYIINKVNTEYDEEGNPITIKKEEV